MLHPNLLGSIAAATLNIANSAKLGDDSAIYLRCLIANIYLPRSSAESCFSSRECQPSPICHLAFACTGTSLASQQDTQQEPTMFA